MWTWFISVESLTIVISVSAGVVDEQIGVRHFAKRPLDKSRRTVEKSLEIFGQNYHLQRTENYKINQQFYHQNTDYKKWLDAFDQ